MAKPLDNKGGDWHAALKWLRLELHTRQRKRWMKRQARKALRLQREREMRRQLQDDVG